MKKSFLFLAAVLSFGAWPARGQCAPPVRCPREVVQQYILWDTGGSLLTWGNDKPAFNPDARKMFSDLFQHYNGEPLQPPVVTVIDDYWLEDYAIQGDKAEIHFGYYPFAEIDSSMRWHRPDPKIMSYMAVFHLILSNKRWEAGTGGRTTVHVVSPPQWLIDNGPGVMHFIKVEAAISYARKVRTTTTSPAARNNTETTLAVLEQLRLRRNASAPHSSPSPRP